MEEFVHHMAKKHGRIDILVKNAGYPFDRKTWNKRFHEVAGEDFERLVEVDVKETFRLSQVAIPLMINNTCSSSTERSGGVIINIASTPAISGYTGGISYRITKAGVIAITKHIALEYGHRNIWAHALVLGKICTEATFSSMTMTERKKAAIENSMKRWGDPREVATIAGSLASEDFAFTTGNTIVMDGGTVLL
jgi:3-oxoacyl-[acyl-carrier protein] reductase